MTLKATISWMHYRSLSITVQQLQQFVRKKSCSNTNCSWTDSHRNIQLLNHLFHCQNLQQTAQLKKSHHVLGKNSN